jgi:hypothetical protein
MSSKKIPMSSSLIALPPAGADIGFWALRPREAAKRAAPSVILLFIVLFSLLENYDAKVVRKIGISMLFM